jgi:hypothetical protein
VKGKIMPDPKRYAPTEEGKKHFMRDCMHTTLHLEKKDKNQGIAQCMQMWRDRGKKKKKAMLMSIPDVIRNLVFMRNAITNR